MGLANSCQTMVHAEASRLGVEEPDFDPYVQFLKNKRHEEASQRQQRPPPPPGSPPVTATPALRKSASCDNLAPTFLKLPTPARAAEIGGRRSTLSPAANRTRNSNARSIVRDLASKVEGVRRISMPEWDQTFLSNGNTTWTTSDFNYHVDDDKPAPPEPKGPVAWAQGHEQDRPSLVRTYSDNSDPQAQGSFYRHTRSFRHSARKAKTSTMTSVYEKEYDQMVDPTCSPRAEKRKSQVNFSQPSQTIIFFDWDDTLFPTTWIRCDLELAWNENIDPSRTDLLETFQTIQDAVANVVEVACVLSEKVCIVTLAEPPWVSTSISLFMPGLLDIIHDNEVEIVYARNYVDSYLCEQAYDRSKFESDEEQFKFWINVKKRAIYAHIESFYSKYEGQSWKNVLSIGDSEFEREATLQSTKAWQLSAHHKGCDSSMKVRAKVVKMLEDPTDEELLAELRLISSWLPSMVERNQGFDIDLEQSNDTMYELNDLLQVCVPDADDDFWQTGNIPMEEVISMAGCSDVVWKLNLGGKKGNRNAYLRRLCWFSQHGRLWYDSVTEERSLPYVPSVLSYKRYRLSEDEGEMVMNSNNVAYLFSIVSVEPPYTEYVLGCDTMSQRRKWVAEIANRMGDL